MKDIPRSATSHTVSLDSLRPGVTYEFRVLAVNEVGYGEPSSPSTAVSGRGPPGKLLAGGKGPPGKLLAGGVGAGMAPPWEGRGQRRAACSPARRACAPTGDKRWMSHTPGAVGMTA